jgi:molybdate transport system ATP-binding protein
MASDASLRVSLEVSRAAFTIALDFEAPPGITLLFGPSGSGKSTTLAAIAGLLRPSRGRISLGDDVWFDHQKNIDRPVHLRRVAFVFQSLALFPHMTAAHNVAYGMKRELSREEKRQRALPLLERFRVGHLADRHPRTFSGGEAQRVALARAFAMEPRVVLLDEPFSAMDRDLRHSLAADLRSSAVELGVPFLHVTHHRQEARTLADHVVLIERGAIVSRGAPADLLP